jgi:hypothetical protein
MTNSAVKKDICRIVGARFKAMSRRISRKPVSIIAYMTETGFKSVVKNYQHYFKDIYMQIYY